MSLVLWKMCKWPLRSVFEVAEAQQDFGGFHAH